MMLLSHGKYNSTSRYHVRRMAVSGHSTIILCTRPAFLSASNANRMLLVLPVPSSLMQYPRGFSMNSAAVHFWTWNVPSRKLYPAVTLAGKFCVGAVIMFIVFLNTFQELN